MEKVSYGWRAWSTPAEHGGTGKLCHLAGLDSVFLWSWTAIKLSPESLAMVSDGKMGILILPHISCVTLDKLLDY